jgi:hypothetical protein
MLDRGHSHACRIEPEVRLEQCVDAWEDGNAELLRRLIGARFIGLDGGNQRGTRVLGLKLAQHAQMIAPKGSRASHGHAQLGFACDFAASFF